VNLTKRVLVGGVFALVSTLLYTVHSLNQRIGHLEMVVARQPMFDPRSQFRGYETSRLSSDSASPPNIPSTPVLDADQDDARKQEMRKKSGYGGSKDPSHLGGFTANDIEGQSDPLWTWMMKNLVVKSVVDVGCGRGISTSWFLKRNASVLCVEGSHDAVTQSYLPAELIVEHDIYRGPWWPNRTFDVAWVVEFTEHIGRQYINNYMPILKKSALVFATHSYWGGWHHVEVHGDYWWKVRYEGQGLIYSKELTILAQAMAGLGPGGQHFLNSLQVFINPAVMALPEHQHLVGGLGCFGGNDCGGRHWCPCKGKDALPESFLPVFTEETKYDGRINDLELSIIGHFEDHFHGNAWKEIMAKTKMQTFQG